jgi:hypothetical protein
MREAYDKQAKVEKYRHSMMQKEHLERERVVL